MELYKHQKEALEDPRRKLVLAFDTGTGKTLTAIKLAEKNNVNCLIITPKSIKEKWTKIAGENHLVLSKEEFRDKRSLFDLNKYNGVIIDEGHFFAGINSGMTKALKNYQDKYKPEYVWILTATPYLSTPWNVYTLAVHCGMNPNYIKFRDMFFVQIYMGQRAIWQPRSGKEKELHALLSKFTLWVDFEQVAMDNNIEYDLSGQTKKEVFLHQDLEQKKAEFFLTEEGIALWTKKHTLQNGFYEDDYNGVKYYNDPKLDYILDKAKSQKKMAIVCRYHRQIERYETALKDLGYNVFVIKGGVKNIEGLCKELDAMDKCIVIIQSNISEGYELPSFPYVIFASLSFAYKDWKQMQGRFLRVNAITPTHTDILLIIGGIDIDVYRSVSNKQDFYIKQLITD